MASSTEIKNLGVANKPLDIVYIYKNSKLEDNKVKSVLLGDYTPETDERVIIETENAGNTPVFLELP